MKKKIIVIICLTILCIGMFQTGKMVGAGSSEPGSSGDPLITKSYLDERLGGIGGGTQTSGYTLVNLTAGQVFSAKEGTCFTIYVGNATVSGRNALVNLSTGELFESGTSAVLYSLYLATGRDSGIKAIGNVSIYVLGGYTIN